MHGIEKSHIGLVRELWPKVLSINSQINEIATYYLKNWEFLLRYLNLSQKLFNGIIIFYDTSGIIRDPFIKSANLYF